MTRSRNDKGPWKCKCCLESAAERKVARAPEQLEFDYEEIDYACYSSDPECPCSECAPK